MSTVQALEHPRESARGHIRRVLEDITRVGGYDTAVFFTLRRTHDGLIYRGLDSVSHDERTSEGLSRFDGSRCYRMSVGEDDADALRFRRDSWSIRRPRAAHINRFTSFEQDYPDFEAFKRTETWKYAYARYNVSDQARALVYHDNRFVGWLAVWRHGRDERFTERELVRLNRYVDEWSRQFVSAESVLDDRVLSGPCHAIVTYNGHIEWASPELSRWLDRDRRSQIKDLLQRLGERESVASVVDGVAITAVRMEGQRGHPDSVLCIFDSTHSIEIDALTHLTALQRDMVSLLTAGMRNREIAQATGLSIRQIQQELSTLFGLFNVDSRMQLVLHLSALVRPKT